jgi:arginyl-tRNA synthetase
MLRKVKMNPAVLGEQLGQYLVENSEEVVGFNVVKGFLNLVLSDAYYMEIFRALNSRNGQPPYCGLCKFL